MSGESLMKTEKKLIKSTRKEIGSVLAEFLGLAPG
jgi:hypothetical protein